MYKPEDERPRGEPLGYADRARLATNLPDTEYMCNQCWAETRRVVQPIRNDDNTGFECVIHGTQTTFSKRVNMLSERQYNQDLNERQAAMATQGSGTALQGWKSPLMVPPEQVRDLQTQLITSLMGLHDFGPMKSAAAAAMARMALVYGLNPFNQELWILPIKRRNDQGKYEVVDYNLFVGIKGLLRAARRNARERGSDLIFIEDRMHILTPEEVTQRGSNMCTRCNGMGKVSYGNNDVPCKKCGGKGRFEAQDVKVVVVYMVDVLKFKTTKAIGLGGEASAVTGIGVWQPGDNIAEGRDPIWQATKRAQADALRKEYDLPMLNDIPFGEYDHRTAIDEEGDIIEGESTVLDAHPPTSQELADILGLAYETPDIIDELVERGIKLGYESAADVLNSLCETPIRIIDSKNIDTVCIELDRLQNPNKYAEPAPKADKKKLAEKKTPVGSEPADGSQKYQAQQRLVELGIPHGKDQNALITELYNEDTSWRAISVVQLEQLVKFAEQAAGLDAAARKQLVADIRQATKEK